MSYLDGPRLHFAGRFQVDTSTVNNSIRHFDVQQFGPQDAQPPPIGNGGLNPQGTHAWEIKGCIVQSVRHRDGSICTSPVDDPIIGAPVADANDQVSAKMVDLDPEQQSVSEIWGLQIRLGTAASSGMLSGNFEVASFTDIWTRVQNGYFDSDSSAFYQSVISSLTWSEPLTSRFLQELKQTSPDRVSIKFILDGFDDDPASSTFMHGRIVGTIGAALADEPSRFVAGRILRPFMRSSPLNYAYCIVDETRRKVILDMGNSIPTVSPGGLPPRKDQLGDLRLAILHPLQEAEILGSIDYEEIPHLYHYPYLQTAGIQEFSVTSAQQTALESTQLGIVRGNALAVLLAENPTGSFVRADKCVYRLNPGDRAEVNLVVTTFGKPAANQKIVLGYMLDGLQAASGIPVGVPQEALIFPDSVVTDEQGRASFTLRAQDPQNPRGFIDGQVYGVSYSLGEEEPPTPKNLISVLVWNETRCAGAPTWCDDVYPTLKQYANLYPVMKRIVDLGDYDSVVQSIDRIKAAFNLPVSDPNYMPVTRDLSRSKRMMLMEWFSDPIAMKEITTVPRLAQRADGRANG